MRVWLITVGEPLPTASGDSRPWRTGLLAAVLADRGADIVWWTSAVDHFTKTFHRDAALGGYQIPGGVVKFLPGRIYERNISLSRLLNHREIAREFNRRAPSMPRPDVILASFPTIELSAAAVKFGASIAVPVVLDIRDLWPDEMLFRIPRWARPLGRIALGSLYRATREAFADADAITAISETYLRWGLNSGRRERSNYDRVFTHGYPDPLAQNQIPELARLAFSMGMDPRRKWAVFMGTFVNSIDLTTVIRAARLLRDRHDIGFMLCGSGERELEWKAEAAGLPNVLFPGWLDQQRILAAGRHASFGLGAYKAGALMSLTNKLFEYMGFGLPIISCLSGEAQALIRTEACGLFYEPGDPESLAAALVLLLGDESGRQQMGSRARCAFERTYSARAVYDRYASYIQEIARQPRSLADANG